MKYISAWLAAARLLNQRGGSGCVPRKQHPPRKKEEEFGLCAGKWYMLFLRL